LPQRLILDHQHVRLEDRQLAPGAGAFDPLDDLAQLERRSLASGEEALHLFVREVFWDPPPRHARAPGVDHDRGPEGQARGTRQALDHQRLWGASTWSLPHGHSSSPKRFSISSPISCTARAAPSPRASTSSRVPFAPHRSKTPMTLLALAD